MYQVFKVDKNKNYKGHVTNKSLRSLVRYLRGVKDRTTRYVIKDDTGKALVVCGRSRTGCWMIKYRNKDVLRFAR